jgi:hypothetical protein
MAAQPPVVTANVASSRKAGETIVFQAATSDENNPALFYSWEFGAGVTLDGAKTAHTYTHAGTYTVRLKAIGFTPEPGIRTFPVTIAGSIMTKLVPENKRRFEVQP